MWLTISLTQMEVVNNFTDTEMDVVNNFTDTNGSG